MQFQEQLTQAATQPQTLERKQSSKKEFRRTKQRHEFYMPVYSRNKKAEVAPLRNKFGLSNTLTHPHGAEIPVKLGTLHTLNSSATFRVKSRNSNYVVS
jgi:hypothetical protein